MVSAQVNGDSGGSFMISAPGKVIVFGEHAVVHGKAAIAAATSLRSYLLVTPSSQEGVAKLDFPDVGLHHSWKIHELPWSVFAEPSKKREATDRVTALDQELVDALKPHLENVSPQESEGKKKIHHAASLSFLYLLLSLGVPEHSSYTYTLRSTIPIASGLGSSASLSVCLSAALLLQNHLIPKPYLSPDAPSDEVLETINKWAFVGEICIHGNPSGVDNTVATRGKAVLFQRQPTGPPKVELIPKFPILPLLLVDTQQPRSTATEVAKVKTLMESHPAVSELLLNSIDEVTRAASDLISKSHTDSDYPELLNKIGELVRINHGLLVSLGVSHPKIERIKELVDKAGVGNTKLTGAGGGGCTFTVIEQDTSPEALYSLEIELTKEGFNKFEAILGTPGVGILKGATKSDGQEITQEAFLKAEGNKEIERIVGVERQVDERWSHW